MGQLAKYSTEAGVMRMVAKICADYGVHAEVKLLGLKLLCWNKDWRIQNCTVPWEVLMQTKSPDVVMIQYIGTLGKFDMIDGGG